MSSDGPTNTTKGEVQPAVTVPYGALRDSDPAAVLKEINRLLSNMDPEFESTIQDINDVDLAAATDESIDSLDIDEILQSEMGGSSRLPEAEPELSLSDSFTQMREELLESIYRTMSKIRNFRLAVTGLFGGGFKGLVPRLLVLLKEGAASAKEGLVSFRNVSKKNLLKIFGILALTGICGFILLKTFKGTLLPKVEVNYLRSLEPLADKAYTYEADEPFEEFNSPLRHPEYVVSVDKIIVNLKSSADSPSGMGMFEFYIEATTKDAAIEVNDREKEVRDVVSRTVENITYDEVATPAGKNKLKLILRTEINKVLTRGRVRRVFFKSVVLKP